MNMSRRTLILTLAAPVHAGPSKTAGRQWQTVSTPAPAASRCVTSLRLTRHGCRCIRRWCNDVSQWWNPDHTVSGDAGRLSIEARVQGCFCETLGADAGLAHMTVSFVNPGVVLRLTGGLGPLGLMGVAGNMTFEFDTVDEHTQVTLRYAVGGYQPGGLDQLAAPVDGVLLEALVRLKNFVERGDPLADG